MRWRIVLISTVWLLLLIPAHLSAQSADGADTIDDISGVDLLFIIDQSGSMGADSDDNVENDPLGLRFFAPLYATEWLGDLHLQRNEDTYRVAVVNFGTNARPKIFSMAGGTGHWLDLNPNSETAWDTLRSELDAEFDPSSLPRHLGYTWPLAAFESAEQLFSELPTDPTRQRAIIVLTDGLPNDGQGNGVSARPLADVASFVQTTFPEPDYRVYAVAMNDASGSFWSLSEAHWQTITNNRAQIVDTNDDVGLIFRDILLELIGEGVDREECPDSFVGERPLGICDRDVDPGQPIIVPPYLRSVSFDFFLSGINQTPTLEINGVSIDPTASSVTLSGGGRPIQRLTVNDPEPGTWVVNVDPPDAFVDIVMHQEPTTGQLDKPTNVHAQQQFAPVAVQYTILDSTGRPLRAYADPVYEPRITANIHADGQSWDVDLETIDLSSPPGAKSYLTNFTPVATGVHTVSVRATSQDLYGNTLVIFEGAVGNGFTVEPVHFVSVDTPTDGQQFGSYNGSYRLTNTDGEPITIDYPIDLVLTLTVPSGSKKIEPIEQNGLYRYTFTADTSGEHQIQAVATITDDDGVVHTVLDEEAGRFDVAPTHLLQLRLIEPSESSYHDTDLYFNRQPQLIRFQIVSNEGRAVDINDVLDSSDNAIAYEIVNLDGESFKDAFLLRPVGNSGIYEAETETLGRGRYTVSAELVGDPHPSYKLGQTENIKVETTFERIRHPLHIPILIGIIITLIALSIIWWAIARWRKSQRVHPARGDLFIVNEYGQRRFRARLEDHERNHIVFDQSDMATTIHVTKLIVTCDSEQAHQSGTIHVKVFLEGERDASIERTMRSRSEMKLGKYRLWLLKDPTDEQLEDRSIG